MFNSKILFIHADHYKTYLLRFFLSLCMSLLSVSVSALPQFINEFHYDNAGGDKNELVEIAGLAGTDLNGWTLDFYNGSNGQIYTTWDLSGLISNQQDGFGALAFSGSGSLQNGGNDGIALVDNLGQLVQFISYEGQLTATEGAAIGQTSMDVGVAESSSTTIGSAIQLSGLGLNEADFTWEVGESSFGFLNEGQSFLVITPPLPILTPPMALPSVQLPSIPSDVYAVSEPSTLMLLVVGLLVLLIREGNKPRTAFSLEA